MLEMDDDDIGGGADDGDHDGSKETPPYWTVTFYPTIGNESEGSRRYFKLETESITLNVRKSNLNDWKVLYFFALTADLLLLVHLFAQAAVCIKPGENNDAVAY